jgi:hypothetical protein
MNAVNDWKQHDRKHWLLLNAHGRLKGNAVVKRFVLLGMLVVVKSVAVIVILGYTHFIEYVLIFPVRMDGLTLRIPMML